MNEAWSAASTTAANTYGTVGMFGYERSDADDCPWGDCQDEYYFYMQFVPYEDIRNTAGAVFRIWFQIGSSTASDWHGVENTVTLTADADLVSVSATNGNFANNQNFDNDSDFRGVIGFDPYIVTIWRFIPRWEQDLTDNTLTRMEKGTTVVCEYDGAVNGVSTTVRFNITLEGALSSVA